MLKNAKERKREGAEGPLSIAFVSCGCSVDLMMEQSHSSEIHHNAVLIACLNDQIVTDGPAGLSDIFNSASVSPLHIIIKGEESVGPQSHTVHPVQPL